MTPYYQQDGVTIFCGDCREILPSVRAEAIITDPVWPNGQRAFPGLDAFGLLQTALALAEWCPRAVVHLGCASDPRFLLAIPDRLPFIRACWLEYSVPSYSGRVLNGSDVAYVFGEPPTRRPGAMVLPGRCLSTASDGLRGVGRNKDRRRNPDGTQKRDVMSELPHPCPRKLSHVRWLCKWFGGASVCDPFLGSGTTALACKSLGTPFVGIEIEERYCELAVKRLAQYQLDFDGVTA